MNRFLAMLLVVLMLGTPNWAQTTPTQERPRPRPGTILETPDSGRITDAPVQQKPASATGDLAGQSVERFEVVGNSSVASDTIRVYLGVNPGDPYNPEAIRKNFTNLWQTGLFDDIKVEAERGDTGVVVRAIVKERPRISSVEYRGNKELNAQKIQEALERDKIDLHIGNTIEQTLVRRAAESIKNAYTEGGGTADLLVVDVKDKTAPKVIGTMAVTVGLPSVRVPVLSKAMARSEPSSSRGAPPLMRTPPRAARAMPAKTALGVAIANAHGLAATSTAMAR